MTMTDISEIVADCEFPGYKIYAQGGYGRYYIQATYYDVDTNTGKTALQHTRKWYVSDKSTRSEVVLTVLKLILTSLEHFGREQFVYRGRRVFHPHPDIDSLWDLAPIVVKRANSYSNDLPTTPIPT